MAAIEDSSIPSRLYNFVRSRQLEGTYPGDPTTGVHVTTSLRIWKGWGWPSEAEWPYDGPAENWPPTEPAGMDAAAKPRRLGAYQRVRDIDECRAVLAAGLPPLTSLRIVHSDWRAPTNAIIPMPKSEADFDAFHAVTLVGYDDTTRLLTIRNFWGVRWGEQGYGYIPYSYFSRYHAEAWVSLQDIARQPFIRPESEGIIELSWGCPDALQRSILHAVELFDPRQDEFLAWALMVERDGFLDIEELFVRPLYRNKGYARRLTTNILEIKEQRGARLRAWIPHVDTVEGFTKPTLAVLKHLSLVPNRSQRAWAQYVAM